MAVDAENSMYVKLLSDPEFNFTPFFDEAVLQWLQRNMERFLKEQPAACRLFIKTDKHMGDVANAIALDGSHDEYLIEFLTRLDSHDDYYATGAFNILLKRLVEAGRAELALKATKRLMYSTSEGSLVSLFKVLPVQMLCEFVSSINVADCCWQWPVFEAILAKLPNDKINLLAKYDYCSCRAKKEVASRLVSAIAQRIPLEELQSFVKLYLPFYKELQCMSCYEKVSKSRPGYTLHRKVCDADGRFPNLYNVIVDRLRRRA